MVDPVYAAAFAGLVTLAASRAARGTVLWLAVVAAAMSKSWLVLPAAAALLVAFAGVFPRRSIPVVGALSGALAVEVLLRWPSRWFHGATALVAFVAVAPCLVAALVAMPARARCWVLGSISALVVLAIVFVIPVAAEAVVTHGEVNRGINAAEGALGSVSNGDASSGRQQLAVAEGDFGAAARGLGAWWTAGARLVPVAAQQRQAVAVAVGVARDVAAVSGLQASRIDFARLHYQGGGIDLAQLRALAGPLGTVATRLDRGTRQLSGLGSGWLVQPVESRLQRLDNQVTKAQKSADLAVEAVDTLPSILGGDGTRHYLVVLMDPAETRGLGGLIVSYGELVATNGRVTLSSFGDISRLNEQIGAHGGHISGPPDYLARYGEFSPQRTVQDVTYAPDLPTVVDVLGQLDSEAGNGTLDGLLVLDPRSLASLLNFTGPVTVPGLGQLTPANADDVLERGQYVAFPSPSLQTARRAALFGALSSALHQLAAGSLPGPRSLAGVLSPVARRGDLLFWSVHPTEQPLLRRVGLAGTFPTAGSGDLLAVVTQNAALNKIDAYLQRSISDHVVYDPSNGEVTATVRVSLHNSAPSSGLSSEVIGSYSTSHLPPGTNLVWLSVYTPLQLAGAQVSGSGRPLAFTGVPELGVMTYSGYVQVGPGQTASVTIDLAGHISGGSTYGLALYQQPMAQPDDTSITVSAAHGWRFSGAGGWKPPQTESAFRDFVFRRSG